MTEPTADAPNSVPAPARKRDPEFWIAIGALVLSGLAMLSSLMQVSVQRNHERAMVWPHVSARPSFSAKGYEFVARNKGLGPALVRDVAILVDGRRVPGWIEALDVLVGPGHGYGWDQISANDLQDTVLGADESSRLNAGPAGPVWTTTGSNSAPGRLRKIDGRHDSRWFHGPAAARFPG